MPFKTSQAPTNGVWDENTTWYFMNFPNSDSYHTGGYLAAEGNGFISACDYNGQVSKGKLLLTQTTKPIKPSALWCIVGDEENGYTFYNKMNPYLRLGMPSALGETKLYGPTDQANVVYQFKVKNTTNGNYSSRTDCCTVYTGTNSYWNNQDGGSSNPDFLKCWTSDSGEGDAGSVICFTEVSDAELAQMAAAMEIPVSTESAKTYFRIKNLRSSKYARYNGDATAMSQTDDGETIEAMWYVMANGDGYYIHNAATSKVFASLNSFTDAGTKMYIKENPFCTGYFSISTSAAHDGETCWDDNGRGGFSGGWSPKQLDYTGTSWSFEQVDADDVEEAVLTPVIASLNERFPGNAIPGYYALTAEERAALDADILAAQTLISTEGTTFEQLFAMEETLNNYMSMGTVIVPTAGKFYRIKNNAGDAYLNCVKGTSNLAQTVADADGNMVDDIFYMAEDGKFVSYKNGQYFGYTDKDGNSSTGNFLGYSSLIGGENAAAFRFYASPVLGKLYIWFKQDTEKNEGRYLYSASAGGTNAGGTANISSLDGYDGYRFTVEEVKYLPVPMNASVGYATLYSPVNLKCEDGGNTRVQAYIATTVNDAKSSIKMVECTDGIPANEAVILKYVEGGEINETTNCVYLPVTSDEIAAPETGNQLEGTFAATMVSEDAYVLANKNSVVALYMIDKQDNTTWKNNGFKAYLPASVAASRFLNFDFGDIETGIEGIEGAEGTDANAVIYDLSGRRVQNALKGVYIVNGKKIIK